MFKPVLTALIVAALSIPAAFAEEKAPESKPAEAAAAAPAADAGKTENRPIAEQIELAVEGRMLLSQKLPNDIVYGKDDAAVTITEYASLTCPHCRAFYMDVFTKIKENYIDTGKVRLVFRHYPLNLNALRAAMALECGVDDMEKKRTLLGAMFQSQPEWAFKEDIKDVVGKLKSVAKIGGIDTAKFDDCTKEKSPLEDEMLRQQMQTQKALGVSSTPTLYINDQKYFDKKEYDVMAKAIDNVLAGKPVTGDAPAADAAPAAEKAPEATKAQ